MKKMIIFLTAIFLLTSTPAFSRVFTPPGVPGPLDTEEALCLKKKIYDKTQSSKSRFGKGATKVMKKLGWDKGTRTEQRQKLNAMPPAPDPNRKMKTY